MSTNSVIEKEKYKFWIWVNQDHRVSWSPSWLNVNGNNMKSLANKKLSLLDHSDSRRHISETFISTYLYYKARRPKCFYPVLFTMSFHWEKTLYFGLLKDFTLWKKRVLNLCSFHAHHSDLANWLKLVKPSSHLNMSGVWWSPATASEKKIIIQSCKSCWHLQWVDWFSCSFSLPPSGWPAVGFF